MPPTSSPSPSPAPPSLRIAVGLLLLLAVLLLASGALTLAGRETVVDRFLSVQPDLDRETVVRSLVLGQVRYLLVGVAALVAAVFLLRRRAWSRWLGLLAVLFLGLLTLLSMVDAGGATLFSLLVVVLCVGAASSLLAGTTASAVGRGRTPGSTPATAAPDRRS